MSTSHSKTIWRSIAGATCNFLIMSGVPFTASYQDGLMVDERLVTITVQFEYKDHLDEAVRRAS